MRQVPKVSSQEIADACAKYLNAGGKITYVKSSGLPQHIALKLRQKQRENRLALMSELQPDHPVDCGPMPKGVDWHDPYYESANDLANEGVDWLSVCVLDPAYGPDIYLSPNAVGY